MTAEAPPVLDGEIRDWARSTGRADKVTQRGRVSDALRAEYMAEMASLGHTDDPPDAPAAEAPPAGGPERPAKPRAARAEVKPRPVKPEAGPGPLARLRGWLSAQTTEQTTTPKGKTAKPSPTPAPTRARTPLTRLIETAWGEVAGGMEHVNIPVARTMAWQAPYVGLVADDVMAHTPIDRLLQPIARAEGKMRGLAAMAAMPVVVGLITAEADKPDRDSLAGVARRQVLQRIYVASVDAQLDMFGSPELASKIRRSAEEQQARQTEVDKVTGMIFADLPQAIEIPEGASAQDIADAQAASEVEAARERELRAAAAAIHFLAPAGPDLRGQAAAVAAAAMGASGNAAAAAEAGAIAEARAS